MPHVSAPEAVRPGDLVDVFLDFRVDHVATVVIPSGSTGGSFTLAVDGEIVSLGYDATSVDFEREFERHFGVGSVIVFGGPLPASPVTVRFTGKRVGRRRVSIDTTSLLTPAGDVTVVATQEGGHSSPDSVAAELIAPGGTSTTVPVIEVGPGMFQAALVAPAGVGVYELKASAEGVTVSRDLTVSAG